MTLEGFWRQHVHYGRGIRHLRGHGGRGRHRFSSAGFYLDLLVDPIRKRRPRALAQSGLNLVSQVATAYGMVRGGRNTRA
jgi:hypothetical protein